MTQSQTINLALVILNSQRIFKDDIRSWKRTNQAYKTWDNFKHDFREAHLELRETVGTIDELGFHNAKAIVDQIMTRLQIDKDKCTAQLHNTPPKSLPPIRPTPRWNHRCRLSLSKSNPFSSLTPPIMKAITAAAAAVDAVRVGAAVVHNCQLCPPQSTAGPTVTADTATNNAHTLLIDTRRRRPLHT